jgi:hypothetical protein
MGVIKTSKHEAGEIISPNFLQDQKLMEHSD